MNIYIKVVQHSYSLILYKTNQYIHFTQPCYFINTNFKVCLSELLLPSIHFSINIYPIIVYGLLSVALVFFVNQVGLHRLFVFHLCRLCFVGQVRLGQVAFVSHVACLASHAVIILSTYASHFGGSFQIGFLPPIHSTRNESVVVLSTSYFRYFPLGSPSQLATYASEQLCDVNNHSSIQLPFIYSSLCFLLCNYIIFTDQV